MGEEEAKFPFTNLSNARQDVHKQRRHDPSLHRYRVAEKLLPSNCSGLSILELGGGIAEFSRRMKEREIRVAFVDLSEHNIRKAQSLGVEAHQLDLNLGLVPFRDAQFDGVVMLEIIEHIVAAEFLLQEVNRVLKPRGFLILSTPNFAFFINRLQILFGKLSLDEGYHYRFFTVKTLKERLGKAGFAIEKTAHTMPAFGINFVKNRILGRPRFHVRVPDSLARLFAQTLVVRARKNVTPRELSQA